MKEQLDVIFRSPNFRQPHSVKWTKGPLKVDAWHLSPWTSVDQVWKPPKSHIPMRKRWGLPIKGPHILMIGAKSSKESPPLVDLAASETVLQHLHPYRQQPGHVREVIAAFWGGWSNTSCAEVAVFHEEIPELSGIDKACTSHNTRHVLLPRV